MEARPSTLIETVSLFVPPACREHVTGDLCERYTSCWDLWRAAVATVPLVVWSQIRRTSGGSLVLSEASALAFSFLSAAARFGDQSFSSGTTTWLRLGMPVAAALLATVLRDAYAGHRSRPPLAMAFDVIPAVTIALAFEAALATTGSRLALPGFITMWASGLSVLALSTVRLMFVSTRSNYQPGGGMTMTMSAQERERIREEETVREEIRQERRRHRRPRLLAMAAVWTLILTALAFLSTHFHG